MANVIGENQASSERNRMSYKRIIRIVIIAFVAPFYLEELFFHSKKVFIIRYFKRIAMIKVIMF